MRGGAESTGAISQAATDAPRPAPPQIVGREQVPPENKIDPRTRARGGDVDADPIDRNSVDRGTVSVARGGDEAAAVESPPLFSLAADNEPM